MRGFPYPELYLDRMEAEDQIAQDKLRQSLENRQRATISLASMRREGPAESDATKGTKSNVSFQDLFPEIISLEDDEESVNLMVYGAPGTGKTVLGGSADRALFLAPEDDGTISAKRQGSSAKKWPGLNTFEDWANAINRIAEEIDSISENFDWLVIDSITHLQRLTMRQILDDALEDNPERDPDIPQMQDWQKYQNMFLRFVQMVNDLPINVLWTALVRAEEDEDGEDFLTPDIQGKGYQMSLTVASYMTSFGYLEVEEKPYKRNGEYVLDSNGDRKTRAVRTITWRDTGKIRGKDRTNALAPYTRDTTLQQIDDLIHGRTTREELAKPAAKKAPAKKAPAKRAPAKRVVKAEGSVVGNDADTSESDNADSDDN